MSEVLRRLKYSQRIFKTHDKNEEKKKLFSIKKLFNPLEISKSSLKLPIYTEREEKFISE